MLLAVALLLLLLLLLLRQLSKPRAQFGATRRKRQAVWMPQPALAAVMNKLLLKYLFFF